VARSDIRGWVKRHPVAMFFLLAYAVSWLAWLPAMLGYRGDLNQVLSMIAQFGPAVAALIVTWYSGASISTGPHGYGAITTPNKPRDSLIV
jgi:hypothetical protein